MSDRRVTIAKIERGIVIDHIPAGKAYLIAQVLGLNVLAQETGDIIAIGINFDSPRIGKKDVIKVENLSLTRDMLNLVALLAPLATVTRIDNGQVIEKHKVDIPAQLGDIVQCPDRFCITNHEEVPCKFTVVDKQPLTLMCHYCETEFFGPLIRFKEKNQ
jgi:aspartate carbamoyltransferase regulatory subunit